MAGRPQLVAGCLLLVVLVAAGSGHASTRAPADAPPSAPKTGATGDAGSAGPGPQDWLSQERLWPYRVSLREPWDAAGRLSRSLPAGLTGVLIRLESASLARVDFGRDGLHDVPLALTDFAERRERIRSGEQVKDGPNFVVALGPRLVDPSTVPPSMLSYSRAELFQTFVCVFFDASAGPEQLAALQSQLSAAVGQRDDRLVVLFPLGDRSDSEIGGMLREIGWNAVFLPDHLSEPYAESLGGSALPLPSLHLTSAEGRLLVAGPWSDELLSRLAAVADGRARGVWTFETEFNPVWVRRD